MPTLAVAKDYINELLGKKFTDDEFNELCFQFGAELDDITSEKEMYMREQAKAGASDAANTAAGKLSDEVIYKIDLPANRYDLLSAEGMSVALRVFMGTLALPKYRVLNRSSPLYTMTVEKSVKHVRDYVVCAVLKNIKFSERSYNSFIDYQEKLHSGLARRRTLASVGTHDLDIIQKTSKAKNSFIYGCRPKDTISFIPLRQTTMMHCKDNGLEQFFKDDRHIGKYVPLISSFPNYPVVLDGDGEHVLSLPPIINSAHSAISGATKNVFIECTAPDHQRASVLVNQMVCAFSQFCEEPFTVEAVKVEYEETTPNGIQTEVTPTLEETDVTFTLTQANEFIGVDIPDATTCANLLKKMMYYVKGVEESKGEITVSYPAVRSDIYGIADVMEDVAIAYGYDNIQYKECTVHGEVTQTALGKVSQLLRQEIAAAGYVELLTFSLCSREDAFEHLNRKDDDVAVHISNPQTIEFQICRPSLLPGMLKTLSANKSQPLPHRFFECSDVVLLDNEKNFPPLLEYRDPTGAAPYEFPGARNQQHLCALHCTSGGSGFESILSLAQYALQKLGIRRYDANEKGVKGDRFEMVTGTDGAFFPSRCVQIILHREGKTAPIGVLGVLHPDTLKAYDISFPCSYMEINIQFLCVPVE